MERNIYKIGKELFITSDEEIKKGDLIFETDTNTINVVGKDYVKNELDFKIILTTDVDLIKDGVQAIDDEFLEWFVKNPSCEYIEVEKVFERVKNDTGFVGSPLYLKQFKSYKIIIPKEESKQETLEEAAINKYGTGYGAVDSVNAFIEGAKWQQERSYSFDELRLWLIERDVYLYNYYTTYKKSGIPMENVDKYIEDSHEYLMGKKKI
jgi:hypothetical protein